MIDSFEDSSVSLENSHFLPEGYNPGWKIFGNLAGDNGLGNNCSSCKLLLTAPVSFQI